MVVKIDTPIQPQDLKGLRIAGGSLVLETTEQYEYLLPFEKDQLMDNIQVSKISRDDSLLTVVLSVDHAAPQSTFMTLADSNIQLWSVKDLLHKTPKHDGSNTFQFGCVQCGATVVDSANTKFVDMPLEFWHEMMDFWHCHKPHEGHHNHNDKHYDGKLVPRAGFVNIGSSYLLVPGTENKCTSCGYVMGDIETGCVKLYKWNLVLQYLDKRETYPPYALVYYSMLDKVNSSAARNYVVSSAGGKSTHVWVASFGLDIAVNGSVYRQATKLLYRESGTPKDEDVLTVPSVVFDSFMEKIKDVNAHLPELCRSVELKTDDKLTANAISFLAPPN